MVIQNRDYFYKNALMSIVDDGDNFETFRECLSVSIIARLSSPKTKVTKKRSERKRKNSRKNASAKPPIEETETDDISELSEFIDVCCLGRTLYTR